MTMTYSFEKQANPWDTEPDFWELLEVEQSENAKADDEISLDELADDELSLDESEFDL